MQETAKKLPDMIGPYAILQSLGRGGMGEVFLAKDPSCGRNVALKRIRPELNANPIIQSRFLREANVASVLTHPSIVPILTIQMKASEVYYTMPFVEGETLRQILKTAREQEKEGELLHPIGRSIPSLIRIFLQVCEAVAYTHSKGIIHRDLKPENIIVGKYGEVMILDWGIADFIDHLEREDCPNKTEEEPPSSIVKRMLSTDLTRPGKIAGTLAYMPPERLLGKASSTTQMDLYALGVILYQLLTLQLPFQRKTIAAFKKTAHVEELPNPMEVAPYRDIPHQLSTVCKKCLAKEASSRYRNAEELIADIKNYIDGKPEWICLGELDPKHKEDWQFQEHILLAKHVAITRSLDITEWTAVMISRRALPENFRINTEIQMGSNSQGIGFLLNIPEGDARKSLEEGYCLWIGSQKNPSSRLVRNNVLILETKGAYLRPGAWHKIQIEKIEDHLKLYVDGKLKLSFTSHLPLAGSYVGLLHKDSSFAMKRWTLYDGSHNVTVNCLAVPNAFLSNKLYDLALKEYRRIGQSFPGRIEGREALFRAGLTLLEKSKTEKEEKFAYQALKEFEKLYKTPGAPLEYLGKSLVYASLSEAEEEAKCLELALRKFPKHPQLPMLKEHIVYRMHESSLSHREAAYRIILLTLRHIPDVLENPDTQSLIESLQNNWEPLPFMETCADTLSLMAIQLSFWLKATPILVEIAEMLTKKIALLPPTEHRTEHTFQSTDQSIEHTLYCETEILLANALFCLIELGAQEKVEKFLSLPLSKVAVLQDALHPLNPENLPAHLGRGECRVLYHLLCKELQAGRYDAIGRCMKKLHAKKLRQRDKLFFHSIEIWSYLLQRDFSAAENFFRKMSSSTLSQEISPLHFPYGTWLYVKEGPKAAMAHFGSVLDTPYPPTAALPSHFLSGRIDEKKGWIQRAFWWEKKELNRQLDLFHRVVGNNVSQRSLSGELPTSSTSKQETPPLREILQTPTLTPIEESPLLRKEFFRKLRQAHGQFAQN